MVQRKVKNSKIFLNLEKIVLYRVNCALQSKVCLLKKIFGTITAGTGLSKGYNKDVHYMDAKEHQSTFVKNVTLDCIKTVLKDTIILKYSQYKRLYNSFWINFAFLVVCINKSYDWNICDTILNANSYPVTPGISLNWRKENIG